GLAGLGGVVDDLAHTGLDAGNHIFLHAELQQPLAVDLDRIAQLPAVELALGAIFRRIGARVAAVAIREAFDQRWSAAGTRLVESGARGAIDRVGIVAVDEDALE